VNTTSGKRHGSSTRASREPGAERTTHCHPFLERPSSTKISWRSPPAAEH
jgi:hypothetical protein